MRIGLACTSSLRRALRDAGVHRWSADLPLDAGDILYLDACLDPAVLREVRGLLLPDIEILVVEGGRRRPAPRDDWAPWRRLRLPEDHGELTGLRTVLHATAMATDTRQLRPLSIHLEVRDQNSPRVPGNHPSGSRGSGGALRAAFDHTGLPWPANVALTLRETSTPRQPQESRLAVAAALLAATNTIPPAALRRYAFVGDVAPDGRVRPVRNLSAVWAAAHTAGYRHLAAPAASGPFTALPHGAIHPVATVTDLVDLLRP